LSAAIKNGVDRHLRQRKNVLAMIDHHLKAVQTEGRIGELIVRLQILRGGSINRDARIRYVAEYDFLEQMEAVEPTHA